MTVAKKKQTGLIIGIVASSLVFVLFTVLLIVELCSGTDGYTEVIPGEEIIEDKYEDGTSESLRFHYRTPAYNRAFSVGNMLPGDSVVQDYSLNVSHKADLELYFVMEPDREYLLANVLMIKVENVDDGETLYEGLIKDMPEKLTVKLAAEEETNTKVDFRVTAYMDTSVGNEYQATTLKANMNWWIENVDSLTYSYVGVTQDKLVYIPGTEISLVLVIIYSLSMGVSGAGIGICSVVLKRFLAALKSAVD